MRTPSQAMNEISYLSDCINEVKSLNLALTSASEKMMSAAERVLMQTEKDVILMDEVRKRFELYTADFSNDVNLNVGGVRFTTSKDTLLAEPDNFFACMIRRYNTVH